MLAPTRTADVDPARLLVAAEREVAGRRARDVAARLLAASAIADVLAVVALIFSWLGRSDAPQGLAVCTGIGMITVLLRQVVLRTAAAAPDANTYRVVYLVATTSTVLGAAGCALQSRFVLALSPFVALSVAGGSLACLAARRLQQAIDDVDLLRDTYLSEPARLLERLADAVADALRHDHVRGRRRRLAAPGAMTRQLDGRAHHEAPGGRGVAGRLALAALVVLLGTLPCLLLLWYFDSAAPVRGITRVPLSPLLLSPPAVLVLLRPAGRPGSFARTGHLVAALLAGAAAAGLAAADCLSAAVAHVPSKLPPGPLPWVAAIGFAYALAAALTLLAASALYEPARRSARQRAELARAEQRIAAAAPAWPRRG